VTPRRAVVAAVFVGEHPGAFAPTVASLRRSEPGVVVVVGGPDLDAVAPLVDYGARAVQAESASALVNQLWKEHRGHVLAVTDTAVFPTGFLGPAAAMVEQDLRVATVSFFCNAASFLSFPHRNTASSHQVESFDEESITRTLREMSPAQQPAPIPFATGPAVLLSSYALSAVGHLSDVGKLRPLLAVADFSLKARRKGFLDLVDPSTFVSRPYDLSPVQDTWLDDPERRWLLGQHPFYEGILDEQSLSDTSALATVFAATRAKVMGLRVLIDGSCLGPKEMGTQVQTISLVAALTRRPDVERVCVALATDIPRYAAAVLADPKVEARYVPDGDVTAFGRVDIGHRPFQPVTSLHPSWYKVPARTAVTIQDLTSYHVGIYHASEDVWLAHREAMRQVAATVDGVVAISHDVRGHLALERLPVEAERVSVVENGTDHLQGNEAEAAPRELLLRGFVAGQFAVVLGTNYAHKNREIAIDVVTELRRRGYPLSLVLAGAAVPFGSSRAHEARPGAEGEHVYAIPDVTSEERNWLLHHASLVLYPTSAEGFGLVPYEAARFGTPTVFVPFGPLGEVVGRLPVKADDWSPASMADAAERLLADPAVAAEQVEAALAFGAEYTWDVTAAKLVEVYRSLLARRARGIGTPIEWSPS
jgi:glycosyltransferase involved in cell wall biosynthesis